MTEYISVHAKINGVDAPTKKALRETLRDNPATVTFTVTDLLTPRAGETYRGTAIPDNATLTVAGPNPFTSRKWYANVKRERGNIRVS